jgi:hypothetical protein
VNIIIDLPSNIRDVYELYSEEEVLGIIREYMTIKARQNAYRETIKSKR